VSLLIRRGLPFDDPLIFFFDGRAVGHGAEKVSFSLLLYGLLALVVPDAGVLSDLVRAFSRHRSSLVVAPWTDSLSCTIQLVKVAADLPFSRKLELEADAIGLRLMARACYDPRAAIQMNAALGALQEKHGGSVGALKYFSTHPPSHERVEALRRGLKDALEIYNASGCGPMKKAFGQAMTPAARALVEAEHGPWG
jgi:hypothetical protein